MPATGGRRRTGTWRRWTTWQVRVTTRARALGESPLWLSGVGLLLVVLGVDLLLERQVNGAYEIGRAHV